MQGTIKTEYGMEGKVANVYGKDGLSAYEIAVKNGYEGTEAEWVKSLEGEKGDEGLSAYEIAVKNGYEGTETEWLKSLKGEKGDPIDENVLNEIIAIQNALIGEGEILESAYGTVEVSVEGVDGKIRTFKLYGREVTV